MALESVLGERQAEQYNEAWWQLREAIRAYGTCRRARLKTSIRARSITSRQHAVHALLPRALLQFQFQKALCNAAGFKGPLYECDVYGSKEAGEKYMAMLQAGASKPWPETLEKLTGGQQMDASAMVEYFQPLLDYLKEQNKSQSCGW